MGGKNKFYHSLNNMFARFILLLVVCVACASAFAPVGGRFLQRSVVAMSKDVAMPGPPAISSSDKDVVGTIGDRCPKLAGAIKAAGLDSALSGGPFTVFAPVDSAVSFALHGTKPPAKMAKVMESIKCSNGYIHLIDGVLEPYEGDIPPSMFLKNTDDPNLSN